ncbi:MAG: hypothetical protein H7Z18_11980 [Methylophilaceae bacterium]|nr:hypothetical protein [Methylophilaceae bacterium]
MKKKLIKDGLSIWQSYKVALETVIRKRIVNDESLNIAANYARLHNLELLKLMNTLTTSVKAATKNKASELKTIQTIALVLSLLLSANIVFNALGKLRSADTLAIKAQRENTEIQIQLKKVYFF